MIASAIARFILYGIVTPILILCTPIWYSALLWERYKQDKDKT